MSIDKSSLKFKNSVLSVFLGFAFIVGFIYCVLNAGYSLGSAMPFLYGFVAAMAMLLMVNIQSKKLQEIHDSQPGAQVALPSIAVSVVIFVAFGVCTYLVWRLTPATERMPRLVNFVQGGPFYWVFAKVGLFLGNILSFVLIFFWSDFDFSNKRHTIPLILFWAVATLALYFDPRWR